VISMVPGVTSDPAEVRGIPRPPAPPAAPAPFVEPVPVAEPVEASHRPPASAPVAPAPLPPASAPVSRPTTDELDIDATRAGAPVARAIASLAWDDGTTIAVFGRTLFGRNPAQEDGAVAVAVRDETLSLSKTHFEVGGDGAGVWVMDRHSTNGTILVRGGLRQQLGAGARMPLRSGDRLEFGDRSVTVGGAA
jgi:hypothetical protein